MRDCLSKPQTHLRPENPELVRCDCSSRTLTDCRNAVGCFCLCEGGQRFKNLSLSTRQKLNSSASIRAASSVPVEVSQYFCARWLETGLNRPRPLVLRRAGEAAAGTRRAAPRLRPVRVLPGLEGIVVPTQLRLLRGDRQVRTETPSGRVEDTLL